LIEGVLRKAVLTWPLRRNAEDSPYTRIGQICARPAWQFHHRARNRFRGNGSGSIPCHTDVRNIELPPDRPKPRLQRRERIDDRRDVQGSGSGLRKAHVLTSALQPDAFHYSMGVHAKGCDAHDFNDYVSMRGPIANQGLATFLRAASTRIKNDHRKFAASSRKEKPHVNVGSARVIVQSSILNLLLRRV